MQSFLERYAGTPLGEVFADQTPVSIFDESLAWLELPDDDFLRYAETLPAAPFDIRTDDPSCFREKATFLLAQAHRIWVTLTTLRRCLPENKEAVLLDLGAYPFSIDVAVRRFLKRSCRIIGTYAQELSPESLESLQQERIELIPANLDPRVHVDKPLQGMTDLLPLEDSSVDVVLFAHLIEHLYHPIQILKDVFRVLKPGGQLILTTDHGFLLGGFLNYLGNGEYVHEPVETTAAMVFNEWRGHVRFYSEGDLRKLVSAAGGNVTDCRLFEVLYNSVPERYFVHPNLTMPRWRANLLSEFPAFRNEILVVAEKQAPGAGKGAEGNPFDPASADWDMLARQYGSGECSQASSTLLDLVFGCRLLYGRWPTAEEVARYRSQPPARGLDGLVDSLVSSREFEARPLAVRLERPGASCILMTETPGGFRYFFSAQDTFVGFPVAVGVFEPDVSGALAALVRKGMTCLDLGANFGFHSIPMAAMVGPQGRVYSFEPEPLAYSLLLKNRSENKMEDIIVAFNVACGQEDREGRLRPHPNPANFGGAFLEGDPTGEGILVAARRVDDLIPPDLPVDVVKIDIEGYELFALRGMRRIVTAWRPVIVCEFNPMTLSRYGPDTATQFLAELREFGYTLYEAGAYAKGSLKAFQYDGSPDMLINLVCQPASLPDGDRA